jgi:chromosome segregation ATPase
MLNETEQIKIKENIKNLQEECEVLNEKLKNQNVLLKSEKGMNVHLKDQINTLKLTGRELSETNDKYLKMIGSLRGEIERYIEKIK